jgi:hypothetical protein
VRQIARPLLSQALLVGLKYPEIINIFNEAGREFSGFPAQEKD